MAARKVALPVHDAQHRIVRVVVSYAWSKSSKTARSDAKWASLRSLLEGVCEETAERASKLDRRSSVKFTVKRLRVRHGMQVLSSILERIREADVYVADVAADGDRGFNPNVMLEVGIAIASHHGERGSLFILKPAGVESPSNLRGVLWTEYQTDGESIRLTDNLGFRAALRSSLLQAAFERALIKPAKSTFSEDETDK